MAKMLDALEKARKARLKLNARELERAARRAEAPPAAAPAPDASQPGNGSVAPAAAESVENPDEAAPPHFGEISELVVAAHEIQSPITEQFRQIRTNLETILAECRSRPIVVSSPVSGDGKSLFSANLACVLGDDPEHRALLIDADMRKGAQHALFGIRATPGLSDYLRGRCSLDDAIHPTALQNLKLMPAGRVPDLPSVLLGSARMTDLLGELQRRYRWILFDSPPILPVTDALVLGRGCVGLLLVVRMDRTNRKMIERAQDVLAETRLPVLGCVLNDFDFKTRKSDYYGRKYGSYGQDDGREGFKS